ncbi:hypothetical protein [Gordonia sp. ABSL49_1]|uniref:hypothetical protein n=1 Tax=Gordonia sp. ABSL49_1 TaxID=2920941 RepID=UPI001F10A1F0|nr:hypothetical protein [Gordonia sp. ABSL49_1]MCH5643964.1 hypothetical protein [Gordonia sp. ABSL49_1]
MTLELQVRESALAQATIEWVQARLYTMCVPTNTAAVTVDHLDTVPGSVAFSNNAAGGVDLRLTVSIFAITQADLVAHPNSAPTGATTAATQTEILIQLGIKNQALTIVKAGSVPAASGLPPAVRDRIKQRVDNALTPLNGMVLLDCSPIISALGAYVDASPDLGRGNGVVALRFGSSGEVVSHLGASQTWGVFLDADEVVGLLKRQIPPDLPVAVSVRWHGEGPTPAIVATTTIDLRALDLIEVASAAATIAAGPSFILPATLRISGHWDIDLSGIAAPFEAIVTKYARGEMRRMFPFVNHNNQEFWYDITLPSLPSILGAQPRWAGISSSPAGMTIGGPVTPAPQGNRGTIDPTIFHFGKPTWWGHCRALARGGSGLPPTHFEPTNPRVRVQAGVNLADAGALCGAEVLSPNNWLGMDADANGVGFDLTVGQARKITDNVQVIVRTARGVRFFDLGTPVIQNKRGGEGLDVQVNWFDDCLRLSGVWLKLVLGEAITIDDFKPPPLEDPNWIVWFHAPLGLNIHLLSIVDLDPDEVVIVSGLNLRIQVGPDSSGVAHVPAVAALADGMHDVVAQLRSRQSFSGAIRVQTAEFTWLAEVGPAEAAAIRDERGVAYVGRIIDGELISEAYRPDADEMFEQIGAGDVDLNPQPLPPHDPGAMELAEAAGFGDALYAHFLPGFEARDRVALVTMSESDTRIVSDGPDGPRESGRYEGPPAGMQVDGGYAIARSGDAIQLYAVERPYVVTLKPR